jgi:hypothetical protein
MKKACICFFLVLQTLFFSACDLFNAPFAEYLYENPPVTVFPPASQPKIPPQLRMGALFAAYNGLNYYPIEPLSESRTYYTICVTPASKTDTTGSVTLDAAPLEPSSAAAVDTPFFFKRPKAPPRTGERVLCINSDFRINVLYPSLDAGFSALWQFQKTFFARTGVDFQYLFSADETKPSFLHPFIGMGVKF